MQEIQCDISVVGAGPAGSVAALYCSEHRVKTLLIEWNNAMVTHAATRIDLSPDFALLEIIYTKGLNKENLVHTCKWYSHTESFTSHYNTEMGRTT
jgi:flavin-dependent dehydrogenase